MRHALFIPLCLSWTANFGAMAEPAPVPAPPMEVRKAIPSPPAADGTSATSAPAPAPAASTTPAPAPATTPAPGAEPAKPEKEVEKKIVYVRCEVKEPVVALTFDDGPHPDFTPRLLDTLKKEGIKATFFMVGRCVVTYPDIVKRMVDEGHEVANHSWSHPQLTALSTAGVDSQMRKTHDAIVKACGVAPTLYRPPYGASRLSQRKRIHEDFGYLSILWDVDPLDWQNPRNSQKVHDRVMAQTTAGSIILCHDIHETTVDAMPATIRDLKARGLQFMTVSQLIDREAKTPRLPGDPPVVLAPMPAPLPVVPQTEPPLPPLKLKAADRLSLDLPGEEK